MKKIIELINKFFDFLLPPECLGCKKEGSFLCKNCLKNIKNEKNGYFSSKNIKKIYFLSPWSNKIIEKAVKKLKFRYSKRVAHDFKPFFENKLNKINFADNAIFVPVPLHKTRLNQRGFNQSKILADLFVEIKNIPVENNLIYRNRNTFPQSKLKGKERTENLKNCISINEKKLTKINKNITIYLIDDVVVTCSTLEECAKPLKKAGFKNISAIVFAKGGV